jgi:hypothetical protein
MFCGSSMALSANSPTSPNPSATQSATQSIRLPRRVANPVRRDLAQRLNVSRDRLQIASSSPETWLNDCLDLDVPGELCIAVPTEGWRVEVSNGSRSWFYRSSYSGQHIRLESEIGTVNLPPQVGDRILTVSSEQLGIPTEKLSISQSQQHWERCEALSLECSDLPGWRAIVVGQSAPNQPNESIESRCWVYRANGDGSKIYQDEEVSSTALVPSFLPSRNVVTLGDAIVFRAIASGGFTRQTYETTLRADGKMWRSLIKPGASVVQTQLQQVSTEQVALFQQLLKNQQFVDFSGLNYSISDAQGLTVTLIGQDGLTQYNHLVEGQLPESLRNIIAAWDQLVS